MIMTHSLILTMYLYLPLTYTADTTFSMSLGQYASYEACLKDMDKLEATINKHVDPLYNSWVGVRGFGCRGI